MVLRARLTIENRISNLSMTNNETERLKAENRRRGPSLSFSGASFALFSALGGHEICEGFGGVVNRSAVQKVGCLSGYLVRDPFANTTLALHYLPVSSMSTKNWEIGTKVIDPLVDISYFFFDILPSRRCRKGNETAKIEASGWKYQAALVLANLSLTR